VLAQLEYKKRHDRMGLRVYWEFCKKYGVKVSSKKWYEECPEKVRKSECGYYEIWWDRAVESPKRLQQTGCCGYRQERQNTLKGFCHEKLYFDNML